MKRERSPASGTEVLRPLAGATGRSPRSSGLRRALSTRVRPRSIARTQLITSLSDCSNYGRDPAIGSPTSSATSCPPRHSVGFDHEKSNRRCRQKNGLHKCLPTLCSQDSALRTYNAANLVGRHNSTLRHRTPRWHSSTGSDTSARGRHRIRARVSPSGTTAVVLGGGTPAARVPVPRRAEQWRCGGTSAAIKPIVDVKRGRNLHSAYYVAGENNGAS